VCTAAMFSSFGPVIAVANLGAGLSQTIAAGKRLLSLLDEPPAAADVADGADVPFSGADCADVRFRYGRSEEYVLDGVSLAVPAGTIVGISGKSGSGKSTLLRLFMRFWDASSGSVRISGTDVKKINTACLRGIESYVTQETVLFHDTIENNIRIAKLDATEDEIREACRKASIIKLIERLPDGFKTQVAELGDNFSGGERQRIGLARSFLHDGGFLLLDEPTSNVDSFNEREILASVKAAAAGRTVVVVSHRASTLEIADIVCKIESGRNS
ncbi:MAG: ATP-binding cassette domain-containing protein, partial [Treponemataceae bacterium]|nr:ATP-binding cassette domain-containing protein [Treponemataceae bacterium]